MIGFLIKSEEKAATEVLTYTIFGAEHLPQLAEEFAKSDEFELVDISTLNEVGPAIKQSKIKFALVIPEKAQEQIKEGEEALCGAW